MRLILLLLTTLLGINACEIESDSSGVWFNPYFGFIILTEDNSFFIDHYCLNKEELFLDKKRKYFKSKTLRKTYCYDAGNPNATTGYSYQLRKDRFIISSESECLPKVNSESNIVLYRPKLLPDFNRIRIFDHATKQVYEITKAELLKIDDTQDILKLETVLALIFGGELDLFSENSSEKCILDFEISGTRYFNSKRVNLCVKPCYLESLFDYLQTK